MEISRPTSPKAAKSHRCYWCGEKIPKGEVYQRFAFFLEGNLQQATTHRECLDAWRSTSKTPKNFDLKRIVPHSHKRGGKEHKSVEGLKNV